VSQSVSQPVKHPLITFCKLFEHISEHLSELCNNIRFSIPNLVGLSVHCATNLKVAGSIPAGVSGFFIDIKSFRSHYGPGVD